jgi:hypothetical protein
VPLVAAILALTGSARADPDDLRNPYAGSSPPGAPTMLPGVGLVPAPGATNPPYLTDESAVGRARELLGRARFLDEAAATSEKEAIDLDKRLPALRIAAKAARDRADRSKDAEHDALLSKAEDLEADVVISEAELVLMRRIASEDRRVARELRAKAVRLVRESAGEEAPVSSTCDPPFRFTPDGRKIYRVECLK